MYWCGAEQRLPSTANLLFVARNGRIERLFGTLKPLLRKIKPASVAVLQNALAEFIHFYNHVRPHQNLGGLTPLEAW